jgi:hypothetical protein
MIPGTTVGTNNVGFYFKTTYLKTVLSMQLRLLRRPLSKLQIYFNAVGSTVAVILEGYGMLRLFSYLKRKRNQEPSLIHHVKELTGAWQIRRDKDTAMELIGVGGYGEVYRCRHRDLFVAMKILRMPTTDTMQLEFEREIKCMQAVRHPNVVLFWGAGRTTDGSAFLVSEFASRGSLRRLLDDSNTSISTGMQVRFCQDVACGMSFSHSLAPPRKSAW